MKALFITTAKYSKKTFPVFTNSNDSDAQLLAWATANGATKTLIVDNFTQSPNSGSVSILKTTLTNAAMTTPNYMIIYGAPLARPFGYFLDFYGFDNNLNSMTFDAEVDGLFYPSITNTYFRADVIKANNTLILPNMIDYERSGVGEKYSSAGPDYLLTTPFEQAVKAAGVTIKGWVVIVTSGGYSSPSMNGLHYFLVPYQSTKVLKADGGFVAVWGNVIANMPTFVSDTGLLGLYWIPYNPFGNMTFTGGDTLGVPAGTGLSFVDINSYKVLTVGGSYSGITYSNMYDISNTNFNAYLKGSAYFTPGEMSYGIGNRAYSDIISNELVEGYPHAVNFDNILVTMFTERVTQYIYNDDFSVKLWECPQISPVFTNDSYLTFKKNSSGILWSNALLSIGSQAIGAAMGDVSSAIGLGVTVANQLTGIANAHQQARNQRDSVKNGNNSNILADMLYNNEYYVSFGYRYNTNVVPYNRFSYLKNDVKIKYNSVIKYMHVTDVVELSLYTEYERSALIGRGIVVAQS